MCCTFVNISFILTCSSRSPSTCWSVVSTHQIPAISFNVPWFAVKCHRHQSHWMCPSLSQPSLKHSLLSHIKHCILGSVICWQPKCDHVRVFVLGEDTPFWLGQVVWCHLYKLSFSTQTLKCCHFNVTLHTNIHFQFILYSCVLLMESLYTVY